MVTSSDGSVVVANSTEGILIVRSEITCEPVAPSPPNTTSGPSSTCSATATTTRLPQAFDLHTAWDASADASVIVGVGDEWLLLGRPARFPACRRRVASRDTCSTMDLTAATSVSDDGKVLVGYGTNATGHPEAWRADLSAVVQPPVGSSEQLRPLPQIGLDQVSIRTGKRLSSPRTTWSCPASMCRIRRESICLRFGDAHGRLAIVAGNRGKCRRRFRCAAEATVFAIWLAWRWTVNGTIRFGQ